MSQGAYIAIAIGIIAFLLIFVFVTFIMLRRMPAPKGCEELKVNDEKCGSCGEIGCPIYARYHREEGEK